MCVTLQRNDYMSVNPSEYKCIFGGKEWKNWKRISKAMNWEETKTARTEIVSERNADRGPWDWSACGLYNKNKCKDTKHYGTSFFLFPWPLWTLLTSPYSKRVHFINPLPTFLLHICVCLYICKGILFSLLPFQKNTEVSISFTFTLVTHSHGVFRQ